MIPSMSLTSGDCMPVVGLGLWKVSREETAGLVQAAIRASYRHLDCACDYGNEAEVGQGIRAALAASPLAPRPELWHLLSNDPGDNFVPVHRSTGVFSGDINIAKAVARRI